MSAGSTLYLVALDLKHRRELLQRLAVAHRRVVSIVS
jgi:hypothetical protein